MKLELKLENTNKEIVRASRQYMLAKGKKGYIISAFVIFIGTVNVIGSIVEENYSLWQSWAHALWFIALLYAASHAYTYFWGAPRIVEANPIWQGERSVTFSEDGVFTKNELIETFRKWSCYKKVWENKEFYYLEFVDGMLSYTMISKKNFESAIDESDFRELMSIKIEGCAKPGVFWKHK